VIRRTSGIIVQPDVVQMVAPVLRMTTDTIGRSHYLHIANGLVEYNYPHALKISKVHR